MVSKYTAEEVHAGIFTTALNSLADGANKITAIALSNDAAAERDLFAKFRLHIAAQAAARSTGARVDLYLLPEENTTFAYGGDALDPSPAHFAGSFHFDAATTARDDVIENIILPPGDFHVLLINETGQAFAATGNTLGYERLNGGYEDV